MHKNRKKEIRCAKGFFVGDMINDDVKSTLGRVGDYMTELVSLVDTHQQGMRRAVGLTSIHHDGRTPLCPDAERRHMTRLQGSDENRDAQALFQQRPHIAEWGRRVLKASPEFAGESISILSRRIHAATRGLASLEGAEVDVECGLSEQGSKSHQTASLLQGLIKDRSVAVIEVLKRLVAQEDAGYGSRHLTAIQEGSRIQRECSGNVTQLCGRNTRLPLLQRGEEVEWNTALAGQLGR